MSGQPARQVCQQQHADSAQRHQRYEINGLNIQTQKICINILQTADNKVTSRRKDEAVDLDKEKVVDIRRYGDVGGIVEMNRVMQLADALIAEIEVFNLQPPDAFTPVPLPQGAKRQKTLRLRKRSQDVRSSQQI